MLRASKVQINGVDTSEYSVKPKGRIEVPTPEQDIEHVEIKGRNGSLTKKYGFKDIPLPVHFYMVGESFKTIFRRAKPFIFNAETLLFNDDEEVFYKVKSASIDTAENIIKKFGEFDVLFRLDPFQYEVKNPSQTITSRTTITNYGYESDPILHVHASGTGNIHVNDTKITIKNINGVITIDSEMMNAYRKKSNGLITNLNKHMYGDFPILLHGENVISFDGDISKIELIKNMRWL